MTHNQAPIQFATLETPTTVNSVGIMLESVSQDKPLAKAIDLSQPLKRKDLTLAEFEEVITRVIISNPGIWANLALADKVAEMGKALNEYNSTALGKCLDIIQAEQTKLKN